jgi:hypothetical protein
MTPAQMERVLRPPKARPIKQDRNKVLDRSVQQSARAGGMSRRKAAEVRNRRRDTPWEASC